MGVQIHGGMGFVEETGAAQYYRDARILPIYEGTNGIQAIDLVTRKLPLAGGGSIKSYIAELEATVREVKHANKPEFGRMGQRLATTVVAFAEASAWMADALANSPDAALASATPYLRLFGLAAGGHYLARGALAVANDTQRAGPAACGARALFCREPLGGGAWPRVGGHVGRAMRAWTGAGTGDGLNVRGDRAQFRPRAV